MSSFFAVIRQSLGMAAPSVTRKVAKERLSIMLVHQRNSEAIASIDMSALQKEVAKVVQKYIKVAEGKPSHMSVKQEGEYDLLEMHFPLDTNGKTVAQQRKV